MADVATSCVNCGNATAAADSYCRNCGCSLSPPTIATASQTSADSIAMPEDRPRDEAQPIPAADWQTNGRTVPTARQQSMNGLAIASLVLGILWLWWLGSVLALIFGYIARKQIDSSNGEQKGRGFAVAGIVLGWVWIGIVVVGIVVGIVVFAVGNSNSTGNVKSPATTNSASQDCANEKATLETAVEAYTAATGTFPASMDYLDGVATAPGVGGPLLKSAPPDYTIDANGHIFVSATNPDGCI